MRDWTEGQQSVSEWLDAKKKEGEQQFGKEKLEEKSHRKSSFEKSVFLGRKHRGRNLWIVK